MIMISSPVNGFLPLRAGEADRAGEPARPRRARETLEGREAVLEDPARLAAPNTEPLDRCAVERQGRRGDQCGGQPIAPAICSWIRRFISIA